MALVRLSARLIENHWLGADARGTPVLLKDIASNIALGPEMRRGAGDFNGEGETVGGIVVVRYGQNVLQVIDRLKAKLAEVKPSLPPGVEIVTTYDRSDLIRRSISTLVWIDVAVAERAKSPWSMSRVTPETRETPQ